MEDLGFLWALLALCFGSRNSAMCWWKDLRRINSPLSVSSLKVIRMYLSGFFSSFFSPMKTIAWYTLILKLGYSHRFVSFILKPPSQMLASHLVLTNDHMWIKNVFDRLHNSRSQTVVSGPSYGTKVSYLRSAHTNTRLCIQ